jgi:hypothetical protein
MSRKNGGIIGPANTPVGGLFKGVAGGVWRMNDVANFVGNSQWPTGPQSIDNSLRFNSGSNDTLKKTFNASNTDTITLSAWVKRCKFGTSGDLLKAGTSNGTNNDNISYVAFDTSDRLRVEGEVSGSAIFKLRTTRKFRDPSAWYHICVAIDSTQATASNRIKVYVNGVQETVFDNEDYMSQNTDTFFNSAEVHSIGGANTSGNFDGYMAEFCFIDGTALDPTSFGEFDTTTGIWKPKKIGSFTSAGTNSFYLDFKDSSNVGNDASGLNNDFTVNNLTSIDQSTDTCVENFAILNPLAAQAGSSVSSSVATFSDGNLVVDAISSETIIANIGVDTGKWFWEVKVLTDQDGLTIGGANQHFHLDAELGYNSPSSPSSAKIFAYYGGTGVYANTVGDGNQFTTYGTSVAVNDIVGVALNLDDNQVTFYKNGTAQNSGTAASLTTLGSGEQYFPAVGNWSASNIKVSFNFGSPSFSISSGNSDANGFGNFEYSVPSGYYALNTSNLNTYG